MMRDNRKGNSNNLSVCIAFACFHILHHRSVGVCLVGCVSVMVSEPLPHVFWSSFIPTYDNLVAEILPSFGQQNTCNWLP